MGGIHDFAQVISANLGKEDFDNTLGDVIRMSILFTRPHHGRVLASGTLANRLNA
jgi:hypothetical protein